MKKKNLVRRYIVFLFGLFISSLGVAFVTKASLGTSPISSIPYVLSLKFTPTLGVFTIYFSLFLILLQIIILGKKFNKIDLLQIPVSILFGYFIDISMFLLKWVNSDIYVVKVLYLLIGCVILGFGVYLEVIADVLMLPGESFVRSLTIRFGVDFGITKVCFDASMTVTAGIISFILFNTINGVREGTIVAALIVGLIAKFFGKHLAFLTMLLIPQSATAETTEHKENTNNLIITIARGYGSGGREIGKLVADKLGIKYFDKDIITLTTEQSGNTEHYVENNEQKIANSAFYNFYSQFYYEGAESTKCVKLFNDEKNVMIDLAAKGDCVILGRLGNFIFKDYENTLHIFIDSNLENKIARVMKRDNLSENDAKAKIKRVETERKNHCKHFSNREWGATSTYDLTLNSSKYSVDKIADIIVSLVKNKVNK